MAETVRVRLRRKRGRGYDYQEVEVPTDAEMARLAMELHAAGAAAVRSVAGWRVLYIPPGVVRYTGTEIDPFTGGQIGEPVPKSGHTLAACTFGHGSDDWRVCYCWRDGADKSPVRIQERGDVVPLPDNTQGTLL
jgi:hypothetical protein